MNFPSLLPACVMRAAVVLSFLLAPALAQADLVWRPETGWRIEGGVLAQFATEADARDAVQLMNQARREQEVKNHDRALRLYRRVIRQYSTSALAPEAHFQSALIGIERRQWTRAFNHLQRIVQNHPDYPRFPAVIEQQYNIAAALQEGERLRLFWVVPGFRSPERAVEYYEQVIDNAPYSEVAPDALLHAAQIQVRRRRLDEAIDLYDRMISEYPGHPRIPEAFFGLAEAFSSRVRGPEYDQGATREAMSYYEDFAILHARHPRAEEAEEGAIEMRQMLAQSRIVIGDFYLFRRSNFEAARVFYNEAITLSPNSPAADDARQRLTQVDRRAGSTAR
jgi:outer membrane protein assembly factor BamD